MNLNGTTVWIIGASSGIGAATARELTRRGASVAISARRQDELEKVASGDMLVVPLDVTDGDALERGATCVLGAFGRIDLVIYAAGYWKQMYATAWNSRDFIRHLEVNLVGLSNTFSAVLPPMLNRRQGRIAAVSSVAGYRGLPGSGGYGATKAAQLNVLESLRIELAPLGVHVTTVSPGFVRTDMTADNDFPMPFIIDAPAAATAICDGLERDRIEIAFPLPMALLSKLALPVPPRLWAALWKHAAERSDHAHTQDHHRQQAHRVRLRLPRRLHDHH
jgi:NAD(P)-dependent dehydrogenase (short-subunit alcohol dehydrogenase family)